MIKPIDFQEENIVGFLMAGKVTEVEIKEWVSLLDQE